MWRSRKRIDDQVLEYLVRDRLNSKSPLEIVHDPVYEGGEDVQKVAKSCIRLYRAGMLRRKEHFDPTRSRFRIVPDKFETIIRRIQKSPTPEQ
jgi:hypothetical protein